MLQDIRIDADREVFRRPPDSRVSELIQERISTADAVFLGLAVPKPGEDRSHWNRPSSDLGIG